MCYSTTPTDLSDRPDMAGEYTEMIYPKLSLGYKGKVEKRYNCIVRIG